jgi:hypothetical protein
MGTVAGDRTGEFKNVIAVARARDGAAGRRIPRRARPLDRGDGLVQRRCREAIRNVMVLRDARSRALNRLLDEALAGR